MLNLEVAARLSSLKQLFVEVRSMGCFGSELRPTLCSNPLLSSASRSRW